MFNPLQNDNLLDVTKLIASADDKLNIANVIFSFFGIVENTIQKGENAGYQPGV